MKELNEQEFLDVLKQIKTICDKAETCSEEYCIFAKLYKNNETHVCPFNETPFRWNFGESEEK